ncbi:MAG: hypothetical protein COA52_10740 [Hyphomicrobiales bacterium]|nr:MAG: hypothetical protein COA52_10740 [Hyphomicrobiales bacterium]
MHIFLRKILVFILYFGFVNIAFADLYPVKPLAPNWCKNAKLFLTPVDGRKQVDCKAPDKVPLCIKLNNYGCLWQPSAGWKGTDIKKNNNGAHDNRGKRQHVQINNGHAVFTHPKWSIRAKLRWFKKRSRGKSFLNLAEGYLPWCDTQGSKRSKNGWYNSCDLKEHELVAGRKYCSRPSNLKPTKEQCNACNCPTEMAGKWSDGTGLNMHDKPKLFKVNGKPTELMIRLTLRNSVNELAGYRPNQKIMREGIALFMKHK